MSDRYVEVVLRTIEAAPSRGDVVDLLQRRGAHLPAQEEVWAVAVDDAHVRSLARVAVGDYHRVDVPIPALLTVPLLAGANRVIIAHNHTSGSLTPSSQDYDLTKILTQALSNMGFILEDHVILAPDGRYLSFRDAELLAIPEEPRPMELAL